MTHNKKIKKNKKHADPRKPHWAIAVKTKQNNENTISMSVQNIYLK